MSVRISSVLQQYTQGLSYLEIKKSSLNELIDELDFKFPGIKFRFIDEQNKIRPHMKIFVDGRPITDIFIPLNENSDVFIVHAISGG